MQQYFKGPVRKMYIKEYQRNNNGEMKITITNSILQKEALFYQNIFGAILSYPHGNPMTSFDDAYWYIKECVRRNPDKASEIWCPYIDYDELELLNLSKEKVKSLKEERKIARKRKN